MPLMNSFADADSDSFGGKTLHPKKSELKCLADFTGVVWSFRNSISLAEMVSQSEQKCM